MNGNSCILSRWALALPVLMAVSGCMATEADTVSDPVVEFPSWSTDHNQSQLVTVTPASGWTIARVEYSVDGTNWLQAAPVTTSAGSAPVAGEYTIALSNLDIGDNQLTLRVTSTYRDQTQVSLFYSSISGVAAVFDCNTPAKSMLPEPRLLQGNGTESRTLVGYFGDPLRHTMTFTINFISNAGNPYQSVGAISQYGRDAITASFSVNHATCDTGPITNQHDCDVPYGLTALVDGKDLCANTTFGLIHVYWDGR
jgi:hypothetical protein